jgi:hypothetical protein
MGARCPKLKLHIYIPPKIRVTYYFSVPRYKPETGSIMVQYTDPFWTSPQYTVSMVNFFSSHTAMHSRSLIITAQGLIKVYPSFIQNYWDFELFPSSGILENKKT